MKLQTVCEEHDECIVVFTLGSCPVCRLTVEFDQDIDQVNDELKTVATELRELKSKTTDMDDLAELLNDFIEKQVQERLRKLE